MSQNKIVKGYKVFGPDWTCRGFQYEVGKNYEMDGKPVTCEKGFHFCEKLADCYKYYNFNKKNKVAEITAYGEIDKKADEEKSCTNKIKIERELLWEEVISMVNKGKNCTELGNSGDGNNGFYNSGNDNKGNCNSGFGNKGNYNKGNYNNGNGNKGDRNKGDYNIGYWNATDFSSGCFNTVEQKVFLFNKISDWTLKDWINSQAKAILDYIDIGPVQKIYEKDMTSSEKEEYSEYKTIGFYIKELSQEEITSKRQEKWNRLPQEEKEIVMAIPNFDKAIFKEITGIDVDK